MEQSRKDETLQDEAINGQSPEGAAEEQGADDEVEALRTERDEMRDRLMRAYADLENTRKRADRERREAEQYGGARLARDILPIFDNLERALAAVPEEQRESQKALIEGLELTMRELLSVFEKHGIRLVSPETGEPFDPKMHQAMFEAPVPGTPGGCVIQVMNQGFMHHDRLLRPAQVGVSSTPPAGAGQDGG